VRSAWFDLSHKVRKASEGSQGKSGLQEIEWVILTALAAEARMGRGLLGSGRRLGPSGDTGAPNGSPLSRHLHRRFTRLGPVDSPLDFEPQLAEIDQQADAKTSRLQIIGAVPGRGAEGLLPQQASRGGSMAARLSAARAVRISGWDVIQKTWHARSGAPNRSAGAFSSVPDSYLSFARWLASQPQRSERPAGSLSPGRAPARTRYWPEPFIG
jgi:hypothetical protein